MKTKLFGIVAAALAFETPIQAQPFLIDRLIAYYPFTGNANDETVNANNGTPVNAVLTTDRFGNANAAYAFNGANAYVSAPNQPYMAFPSGGDFTMSVWAAAASAPADSSYATWSLCALDNGAGAHPKWIFYYGLLNLPDRPAINSVGFHTIDYPGMGYWLATSPVEPDLGSWRQYVVTKTGSDYQIYIDGVPAAGTDYRIQQGSAQSEADVTGPDAMPSGIIAPLTIGWAEGGAFFDGKLDDVRLYSRALSASEVQQLHAFEAPSVPFQEFAIAEAKLQFGQKAIGDQFRLAGRFTLANGSTDYDPADDSFAIEFGQASICITAGSFVKHGNKNLFFTGQVGSASVRVQITQFSPSQFGFTVDAGDLDLSGTAIPPFVRISAGKNIGDVYVPLKGVLTLSD